MRLTIDALHGRDSRDVRSITGPRTSSLPTAALVTAAVAVGWLLRARALGGTPLTFDEGATLYFSRQSLAHLWGAWAWRETNPPLFYTLEALLSPRLGNTDAAIRLISALCGTATIVLAFRIARRLAGDAAGVVAAWLAATSAVLLVPSQSARTYAMLAMVALLLVGAALRLADIDAGELPNDRRRIVVAWSVYVAAAMAALYLHNTATLMLACASLIPLVSILRQRAHRPIRLLHWAAAHALIGVCYLPWIAVTLYQTTHTLAHFWIAPPTLADLRYAVLAIYGQPDLPFRSTVADLAMLGLGAFGIVAGRRRPGLVTAAIVLLAGVPLLTWGISHYRPLMNGKTLLWLTPLFLIVVAIGVRALGRFAAPAALLLIALQLLACRTIADTRWDEGFRTATETLAANAQKGDGLHVDPPSSLVLLKRYGVRPDDFRLSAATEPDPWYASPAPRTDDPARICGGASARRCWLLVRAPETAVRVEHDLATRMTLQQQWRFGGGLLNRYPVRTVHLDLFTARPR